jgi:hypothetical protein
LYALAVTLKTLPPTSRCNSPTSLLLQS